MTKFKKEFSVALLNDRFFPILGTAIRTLNFARALKSKTRSIRIISWSIDDESIDANKIFELSNEGIPLEIARIRHPFLREHFHSLYSITLATEYSLFVKNTVSQNDPDIIQCCNETMFVGALLKGILKKPIIVDLHAAPIFEFLPFKRLLSKALMRFIDNFIDGYICPTENVRQLLVSWGFSPKKVKPIANTLKMPKRIDENSKSKIRSKFQISPDTTLAVFHGNLATSYNIDALNHLNNISKIVGDNLKIKYLIMGYCEKPPVLSDKFIYTGYVENLNEYLSAADFALIPIFENTLGMRSRLLDYFIMSLPVVTTPIGITGMKFAEQSGAVIVKDNIKELAQTTIDLASSREKLQAISKKSKEMVEIFSPEKTAESLLSFYCSVTEEWNSRHAP